MKGGEQYPARGIRRVFQKCLGGRCDWNRWGGVLEQAFLPRFLDGLLTILCLEFFVDVLYVGMHRVGTYEEAFRDLLVGQPLLDTLYDILFLMAQYLFLLFRVVELPD